MEFFAFVFRLMIVKLLGQNGSSALVLQYMLHWDLFMTNASYSSPLAWETV